MWVCVGICVNASMGPVMRGSSRLERELGRGEALHSHFFNHSFPPCLHIHVCSSVRKLDCACLCTHIHFHNTLPMRISTIKLLFACSGNPTSLKPSMRRYTHLSISSKNDLLKKERKTKQQFC